MELKSFHIMCSVHDEPRLLRISATNGKAALTIASRTGTNLVVLFATRLKATA